MRCNGSVRRSDALVHQQSATTKTLVLVRVEDHGFKIAELATRHADATLKASGSLCGSLSPIVAQTITSFEITNQVPKCIGKRIALGKATREAMWPDESLVVIHELE